MNAAPPLRLTAANRAAIVVGAGAALISVTMGLRQSFGLLQLPYTEALSLGRGTFSFAIALQNLLWGFASPFFGAFADRRGPVPAALIGALFYIAGLLAMAAAEGAGGVVLAQMLVGMGMAGAGFSVVLGAVGKSVRPEKRSIALAFVTAGGSFGQFALVPVSRIFIDDFGASGGVYAMAAVAALLLIFAPGLKLPKNRPARGRRQLPRRAGLRPALARLCAAVAGVFRLRIPSGLCGDAFSRVSERHGNAQRRGDCRVVAGAGGAV